ncbi:hypothetical protein HK102_006413, partial [Quaeritorhiza haematococci]
MNSAEPHTRSSLSHSNNHDDDDEEILYFDYNATTPIDPEVAECITDALVNAWANPSSGYKPGKRAKQIIQEARSNIANMIGAKSPQDILFTSGGTESNNLVFHSVISHFNNSHPPFSPSHSHSPAPPLPHIIISNIEHDSIRLTALSLLHQRKIELSFLKANEDGVVHPKDLEVEGVLRSNTVLVSVMLANNETGVIQPIREIGEVISRCNAKRTKCPIFLHTDAAQAIGKISVDVRDLGVDYLTIVGHK